MPAAAPRAPLWKRRASRSRRWSGAKAEQVIFTSGATEANTLALFGAVEGSLEGEASRITRLFVSAIEHTSVLATADKLAERFPWVRRDASCR